MLVHQRFSKDKGTNMDENETENEATVNTQKSCYIAGFPPYDFFCLSSKYFPVLYCSSSILY